MKAGGPHWSNCGGIMTGSRALTPTDLVQQVETDGISRGRAEFVLRKDGSILLILHATKDDERKRLHDLDGKRVRIKTAQHYGDEIWLSFSNESQ